MSGAVDFLAAPPRGDGRRLGVIGFCMGGMLSFMLAALRPDRIKAVVPFYGFPQGDDGARLVEAHRPIRGHMAEHDDFFGPDAARATRGEAAGPRQGRAVHGAPRHGARVHGAAQHARHA